MMCPMVLEKDGRGDVAAYDIYSRLLKDRIIFLGEDIDEHVASSIIAQFIHLSSSNKKPISLYIMSHGGDVHAGLAIYDTMQYVRNQIATYCVGYASSMASVLLAAGTKGYRFALPSSRIMIHQPWVTSIGGDARDVKLLAEETEKTKNLLYRRLAKHTGRTATQLEADCDRDFYMSPTEALQYGIIDSVLQQREE